MADPATDIQTDPLGGLDIDKLVRGAMPTQTVDVDKAMTGLKKVAKEEAEAKAPIYDRMTADIERDKANVDWKAEGISPVPDQKWDADAERKKHTTDPMESFGSFGFIAATLASAFTRQPMINALTAAGSYLGAVNDKDNRNYEAAYNAFKENSELAIKRHTAQLEDFDVAIKKLNAGESAGRAELAVAAAKYGDKRMQTLLDAGYDEDIQKYVDSVRSANMGMIKQLPEIEKSKAQRDAYQYEIDVQGKDKATAYRDIYAPASSLSLGNFMAAQMRDAAEDVKAKGGDKAAQLAAAADVKAKFNVRAEAAKNPQYANEAIEGLEKEGVQLPPETKSLVAKALGDTKGGANAARLNSNVAGAIQEIHALADTAKSEGRQPPTPNEVSKIIRDAVDTTMTGNNRVDQGILNELENYPGLTKKDLGYIGVKNQENVMSSIKSAKNIEHISDFIAEHPQAVGLIANATRQANFDAFAGMKPTAQNFLQITGGVTNTIDQRLESEARRNPMSAAALGDAKVLNKMLATQAFLDAAAAGSRGATIYLDKAFREIYQQSSNIPTLFRVLHEREWTADQNLSEYKMNFDKRKDADQTFPFWKNDAAFLDRANKKMTGSSIDPGHVEDGYRFKGGDPKKQENWEKVE